MSQIHRDERPLVLLSIDGGGIRGLSSLFIIQEILLRIKNRDGLPELPLACQVFDLAGGTGTGGLIVIMLFRLRMKIDDAIKAYCDLASKVFNEEADSDASERRIAKQEKARKSQLEKAVISMIKTYMEVDDEKAKELRMWDGEPTCLDSKAFVCASYAKNLTFPVCFRTWAPRVNPTHNCTIIEAALATCAAPGIIAGVEIMGQAGSIRYIGADLRWNNPVKYVWKEAVGILPTEANGEFPGPSRGKATATCIVSVGTGKEEVIAIQPSELEESLKRIARDCEETSETASTHCDAMGWRYVRLNVDQGIQGLAWKEWGTHGTDIELHTGSYLQKFDVDKKLRLLETILRVETSLV